MNKKWGIMRVDKNTSEKTHFGNVEYTRKTDVQKIIGALQKIFGNRFFYYVIRTGDA